MVRQAFNTLIVFLASGLWHGASWHYIVWGATHAIYQICGLWTRNITAKIELRYHLKKVFGLNTMKIIATFILTDISWVIFRAPSCTDAVKYFKQMGSCFYADSLLTLGLNWYDWLILMLAMILLFVVDLLHEKGLKIRKLVYKQRLWVRWLIYLTVFWSVLLFGIYGVNYDASQFIYFQF